MEKKKPYRILIFDDSEEIRSLLYEFFNRRQYEVFSFPNPGVCPISHEKICPCPTGEACSDFILSDLNMPVQQGIDFLEGQIRKGCQCKNMTLMSGDFTEKDVIIISHLIARTRQIKQFLSALPLIFRKALYKSIHLFSTTCRTAATAVAVNWEGARVRRARAMPGGGASGESCFCPSAQRQRAFLQQPA